MSDSNITDFGYQQIPEAEKVKRVGQVFSSVANKYDIMNDLMSLGIHRWWKRLTLLLSGVRAGHRVLDVASGTGDLAKLLGQQGAEVCLSDINMDMLQIGRNKVLDAGLFKNIQYAQANAENLPFPDNHFDCVTIAFGLRNVTRKENALKAMYRVLKPGGRLLVLEFSQPFFPGVQPLYDLYSKILPQLGNWIANDAASYQYLVESIRMHPNQEKLKAMILASGFDECDYYNFSGGIVALHRAFKY